MAETINYRSLEWMPKSVWGPIKWKELHWRALITLPIEEEKAWFDAFMESLPCAKCRLHFAEFVGSQPPDFRSRERFFDWTVRAHNHVNQATGKAVLTMEEARLEHSELVD